MCRVSLLRVHIYEGQSPIALVKVKGVNVFDWPDTDTDTEYLFNVVYVKHDNT